MADFAMILSAVDHALGTAGLQRYLAKQGELAADSLTADAFVQAVGALGEFQGTSAELLAKVAKPEKPPKGWPVDARAVTQRLRRQAPVMRKAGWEIEDDGGTNHRNVAIWSISRPPERDCISPSHASQPPKALENGHFSREDS